MTTLIEPLEPRRLLAAGDLDPTFGVDGVLVYNDIPAPAVGLATQSDGKYLIATLDAVYRFRPDGWLDKSFGQRGHVTPGFTLQGLGVDHQGRIAVGGFDLKTSTWAAARYAPDGSPDSSFNHTGQVITHVNGSTEEGASAMALQPDGKILLAGTRANGNNYDDADENYDAVVVRFNVDGTVDTAFGANGEAFDVHLFNSVNAIAIAPNGNIAIAGQENLGMSIHDEQYRVANPAGRVVGGTPASGFTPDVYSSYRAAYFRPDGTRVLADETYGNSFVSFDDRGVQLWFNPLAPNWYADEKVNAILATSDNKTLFAGYGYGGGIGLERFNPDGTPDNSFGFGGATTIDLNHRKSEWIDALALLPNGDFLAAGTIGGVVPDNPDPDARLFVAHIKGGAHPVGDLTPRAALHTGATSANATQFEFDVTYGAEQSIDPASIGNRDVRVLGPNGYSALAQLVSVEDRYNGRQRIATYSIDAPGGTWTRADNGAYTVYLRPNQITDNLGHPAPGGVIGAFQAYVPSKRHRATTPTSATSAIALQRSLPPLRGMVSSAAHDRTDDDSLFT